MNKRTKVEKTASSEQDLFERTMAGVRPLKKKTSHKKVNPPKSASYKSKAKFIKKTEFNVLEKPTLPRKDLIKLDPLSAEKVSGVDKRTVDRMRRGKLPIDARLDLHGEYQTTAQAQLESFILNCFEADCRLVLVITGKGLTRNSTGVLRKRLPEWLNKPKCREVTLSFCAARPEHGGEGASYILLKRKRNRH